MRLGAFDETIWSACWPDAPPLVIRLKIDSGLQFIRLEPLHGRVAMGSGGWKIVIQREALSNFEPFAWLAFVEAAESEY